MAGDVFFSILLTTRLLNRSSRLQKLLFSERWLTNHDDVNKYIAPKNPSSLGVPRRFIIGYHAFKEQPIGEECSSLKPAVNSGIRTEDYIAICFVNTFYPVLCLNFELNSLFSLAQNKADRTIEEIISVADARDMNSNPGRYDQETLYTLLNDVSQYASVYVVSAGGAPAYFTLPVRQWLDEYYPGRWIERDILCLDRHGPLTSRLWISIMVLYEIKGYIQRSHVLIEEGMKILLYVGIASSEKPQGENEATTPITAGSETETAAKGNNGQKYFRTSTLALWLRTDCEHGTCPRNERVLAFQVNDRCAKEQKPLRNKHFEHLSLATNCQEL
ncbi:hypothetical protein ANN_08059 [Periplaneta americana]|uniref:Uncharacterized protein n=1 Tax=Periplaneta americana TaxID=6978 RepID=A0ABQ8T114_PERAM|nr:hypothetical protein ANN_08059 [Periplaneta americana]